MASLRSIKNWAIQDRPREKLDHKGASTLSESELIAIIIRSGTKKKSAVEVSRDLLTSVNNDLNKLARLTIRDLVKFEGIGMTKATTIVACLELGRRKENTTTTKKKITSSKDINQIFSPSLGDLSHEEFWILLLDRANQIIAMEMISKGGVSGTVADSKIIFKKANNYLASSIIACHNHPSGNKNPSQMDIDLTKKLRASGEILDVKLLDHVIIAGTSDYFSFADEGLL